MFSASTTDPATLTFRTRLTQDSARIPDAAQENDRFGGALSFRDGRLAIGAYGEQFGRVMDAGLVQPLMWHEALGAGGRVPTDSGYVIRSDGRKLSASTKWTSIAPSANTPSSTYGAWGFTFAA